MAASNSPFQRRYPPEMREALVEGLGEELRGHERV